MVLVLPFTDYQLFNITWPDDLSKGIPYTMDLLASFDPPSGVATFTDLVKHLYTEKKYESDLFLLIARTPQSGAIYVYKDGDDFKICGEVSVSGFITQAVNKKFPGADIVDEDLKIRPGEGTFLVPGKE